LSGQTLETTEANAILAFCHYAQWRSDECLCALLNQLLQTSCYNYFVFMYLLVEAKKVKRSQEKVVA
jgi:hypothetical protein